MKWQEVLKVIQVSFVWGHGLWQYKQISISVTQTTTERWYSQYSNNYLMIQSTIAWASLQNKFKLEHAIFFFWYTLKIRKNFQSRECVQNSTNKYLYILKPRPNENFLFNFVSWTKKFFAHMSIIKFSCCVYQLGAHETEKMVYNSTHWFS